jgi:hypothetical protein
MTMVARIERRGRIARCERRRCGLADDGRAGRPHHLDNRRIRARPPAPVDRRAHLGRKVRRVHDVLDAHGDAAQRTRARRARGGVMTDKGADRLVLRADCVKRLRDRHVGRKLALFDPALNFGERQHWRYSLR